MASSKILFITVRADHGGGPKHLDLLINYLSDQFEIFIACPDDEPYYTLWRNNRKVRKMLQIPHRKFTIASFRKLVSFVRANGITIIHSHGKGAGVYARLLKIALPSVKIIHTFHGVHIQEYGYLQKKAYILFEKAAGMLTDRFINVSEGEKQICLSSGFSSEKKTAVIYNGIAQPHAPDLSFLTREEGNFVVASISRFDYSKNMQLAFEIAKALQQVPQLVFLWIGDGPDKAALEEKARQENVTNIIFTGFKDNPTNYLYQSDVYLSTSRWEGLPIALVEAASIGLPIVASDVTGNNEVVAHGQNGFLYKAGETDQAAGFIQALQTDKDLYQSLSQNSSDIFRKYFRVENMVKATEAVYLG